MIKNQKIYYDKNNKKHHLTMIRHSHKFEQISVSDRKEITKAAFGLTVNVAFMFIALAVVLYVLFQYV